MLDIRMTKNYAGVEIKGDYDDFDELYDCIYEVIGDEEDNPTLEKFRIQILGFCYELRHAKQGDRDIELIPNYIGNEIMKYHSAIMPTDNVYYKFNYIFTQIIFTLYALNIFIDNYSYRKYKGANYGKIVYDENVNIIQMFESKVLSAIVGCLSEKNKKKFFKFVL